MNGYNSAASAAVDAGDNVWITDSGQASKTNPGPNGLYKYDPFPSLNLIATPNTYRTVRTLLPGTSDGGGRCDR